MVGCCIRRQGFAIVDEFVIRHGSIAVGGKVQLLPVYSVEREGGTSRETPDHSLYDSHYLLFDGCHSSVESASIR